MLCAAAGLLALVRPVAAGPANGFGLAGGPVVHSVRTQDRSGTLAYTSAGVGLFGDAQFTVDDRWSLDPYLALTAERAQGDLSADVSNGMAGFQLRRWAGDRYLAAQVGYHVELRIASGRTSTFYGPSAGIGTGVERESGLTYGATFDALRLFISRDVRLALRIHVGWRWR
ncbi:MAG: hypothetical protein HY423_10310 [Candidatus Lambdaproteobacteria bacterium]|nr:hypothetical protein [Candidatus Lambdaproteobacteria bacterium]